MTLLEELKLRGFIHQCTDENNLEKLLKSKSVKFYIGFDCTAQSLHVGSLIQIMIMRLFQKYGHQPIALIGGGTTKIGDPSGKDETRKMITSDEINKNANNLKKVFNKFLNFSDQKNNAIFKDNSEWLDQLNYVEFLRNFGKHFTINKMLSFESVKLRLDREQSLSFVEFNYMIFQAYDFYELHSRDNCELQVGGSDQWGNIVNGIELIRRVSSAESYGLTTPLLTNANGEKMGKTANGAVWLDEEFLSSYDYWQFWRNTDDRDVVRFLKLFTDLPIEEIEQITNEDINNAKIILANEATTLLHGELKADQAKKTANEIFDKKNISENLPTIKLQKNDFKNTIFICDLILQIGFSSSKSEARKLIRANGVKMNHKLIEDELSNISIDSFNVDSSVIISVGKKKHFRVILAQ